MVRVNDGLYTERQIPLVRELLYTYRLAGDVQALDERYDYFFRLYGYGQPPYTELRLRASLEFLRWQREAFRLGTDGNRNTRLLDMYQLYKRILEAVAQAPAVGRDWYRQLVLSQIRNFYLLQSEIEPPDDRYMLQSNNFLHPNRGEEIDIRLQRLKGIRQKSASEARSLLQELVDRFASGGNAADLAGIHLELGDWNLWNGNPRSAYEAYSSVIEILEDAGNRELLDQWLASPVELPANGAFWQPGRREQESRQVVLLAE